MQLTVYGLYDRVDSALATISMHRTDESARRFIVGNLRKNNYDLNDFQILRLAVIEDTTGEVVADCHHQAIPLVVSDDTVAGDKE